MASRRHLLGGDGHRTIMSKHKTIAPAANVLAYGSYIGIVGMVLANRIGGFGA